MTITGSKIYILIVFVISLAITSAGYFLDNSVVMNIGLGAIIGNFLGYGLGYGLGKLMFRKVR